MAGPVLGRGEQERQYRILHNATMVDHSLELFRGALVLAGGEVGVTAIINRTQWPHRRGRVAKFICRGCPEAIHCFRGIMPVDFNDGVN